jgi:hypothetical protein
MRDIPEDERDMPRVSIIRPFVIQKILCYNFKADQCCMDRGSMICVADITPIRFFKKAYLSIIHIYPTGTHQSVHRIFVTLLEKKNQKSF